MMSLVPSGLPDLELSKIELNINLLVVVVVVLFLFGTCTILTII